MDHLRRLGLETRARARQRELETTPSPDEREAAAIQQLDELLELALTGRLPVEEGARPTGRAVLMCLRRLGTGDDSPAEAPDHVAQRRARTHEWVAVLVDALPRLVALDPGVTARAHRAADDVYRLAGTMRKPSVIAAACLSLAIRRCTVDDLRRGEPADGSLYDALY
jgi:hypothetical protein